MCRVLTYLGKPILIDDLLYNPDSSLVKQSYDPRQSEIRLNITGFGMAAWSKAWNDSKVPLIYKTTELPFHDENLKSMSENLRVSSLLAHVRGVPRTITEVINKQNAHPFCFKGYSLAMAHNGVLHGYQDMRLDILNQSKPEVSKQVVGTTDSELIYALLMSQFDDPTGDLGVEDVSKAVIRTFQQLSVIRKKHNIEVSSPINLFISNGEFVVVTRFVYNYGYFSERAKKRDLLYHSLWYTYGEEYGYFNDEYKMRGNQKKSITFASEPLTKNVNSWVEVPEYSLVSAWYDNGELTIQTRDLDI